MKSTAGIPKDHGKQGHTKVLVRKELFDKISSSAITAGFLAPIMSCPQALVLSLLNLMKRDVEKWGGCS
jgi:hypothetical protein